MALRTTMAQLSLTVPGLMVLVVPPSSLKVIGMVDQVKLLGMWIHGAVADPVLNGELEIRPLRIMTFSV